MPRSFLIKTKKCSTSNRGITSFATADQRLDAAEDDSDHFDENADNCGKCNPTRALHLSVHAVCLPLTLFFAEILALGLALPHVVFALHNFQGPPSQGSTHLVVLMAQDVLLP